MTTPPPLEPIDENWTTLPAWPRFLVNRYGPGRACATSEFSQPWPDSTKGVWSLLGGSDKLFAGGDFTTMEHGADVANRLAEFTITPSS